MLTMGVDIGSTACKCIIMEDGQEIKARAVVPLGTGTQGSRTVFEAALTKAGKTREEIERILVTGSRAMPRGSITCCPQPVPWSTLAGRM